MNLRECGSGVGIVNPDPRIVPLDEVEKILDLLTGRCRLLGAAALPDVAVHDDRPGSLLRIETGHVNRVPLRLQRGSPVEGVTLLCPDRGVGPGDRAAERDDRLRALRGLPLALHEHGVGDGPDNGLHFGHCSIAFR